MNPKKSGAMGSSRQSGEGRNGTGVEPREWLTSSRTKAPGAPVTAIVIVLPGCTGTSGVITSWTLPGVHGGGGGGVTLAVLLVSIVAGIQKPEDAMVTAWKLI